MSTPESNKDLIFVADPMCSWCWGFAPTIRTVREVFGTRLNISLLVGGLRPGTIDPMDDEARGYVRHHWEEVAKTTGQPFDFSFFDRSGFIYDTEIPCRAAVTVRSLKPDAALDYFEDLHRAFYAENRDITDAEILTELAADHGIDGGDFTSRFASDEVRNETRQDFERARNYGVTGFPTLIARQHSPGEDDQYAYLSAGYRPYKDLKAMLQQWIDAD